MGNTGNLQRQHLGGSGYVNHEEIITTTDREAAFLRHCGLGMVEIMRKGVKLQGQVVYKDHWGRGEVIHRCELLPAERTCLFHFSFEQRWEG